jgi:hypothetical protein
MRIRTWVMPVLMVATVALIAGCATSEPKSDLNIDVDDNDISVAVSEAVARGFMENLIGSDLNCRSDIDGSLKELLLTLDRNGPRSHATVRDGETTLAAHRRGGRVDLDISGSGSGRIEATMPWAAAECLLGKTTTIDHTVTSVIRVKVTNPEGRNFSFKLD